MVKLFILFFLLVCFCALEAHAIPEASLSDRKISPNVFLLYNGEARPSGTLSSGCTECNECTHGCQDCGGTTYCCCGSENACCNESCGENGRSTCSVSSCGGCDGSGNSIHTNSKPGDEPLSPTGRIIAIVVTILVVLGLIGCCVVQYYRRRQLYQQYMTQYSAPVTYQNVQQQQSGYPVPATFSNQQQPVGYSVPAVFSNQQQLPVPYSGAVTYQTLQQQPQIQSSYINYPTSSQPGQAAYVPVVVSYPPGGIEMTSTQYSHYPPTNQVVGVPINSQYSHYPTNDISTATPQYPIQGQQYTSKL